MNQQKEGAPSAKNAGRPEVLLADNQIAEPRTHEGGRNG